MIPGCLGTNRLLNGSIWPSIRWVMAIFGWPFGQYCLLSLLTMIHSNFAFTLIHFTLSVLQHTPVVHTCVRNTTGDSFSFLSTYKIKQITTNHEQGGHYEMPRIMSRNARNLDPWRGLVQKSPTILSVGQYSTERWPFLTWSVRKK